MKLLIIKEYLYLHGKIDLFFYKYLIASVVMDKNVKNFLDKVSARNSNEPEFMQAVHEVAETIIPFIENKIPE